MNSLLNIIFFTLIRQAVLQFNYPQQQTNYIPLNQNNQQHYPYSPPQQPQYSYNQQQQQPHYNPQLQYNHQQQQQQQLPNYNPQVQYNQQQPPSNYNPQLQYNQQPGYNYNPCGSTHGPGGQAAYFKCAERYKHGLLNGQYFLKK